jgi:hypothetical protein
LGTQDAGRRHTKHKNTTTTQHNKLKRWVTWTPQTNPSDYSPG